MKNYNNGKLNFQIIKDSEKRDKKVLFVKTKHWLTGTNDSLEKFAIPRSLTEMYSSKMIFFLKKKRMNCISWSKVRPKIIETNKFFCKDARMRGRRTRADGEIKATWVSSDKASSSTEIQLASMREIKNGISLIREATCWRIKSLSNLGWKCPPPTNLNATKNT